MGYDKYSRQLPSDGRYRKKLEYKTYRVKSPIKSFRDLEVYKDTTQLAVEIFQITIPNQANQANQVKAPDVKVLEKEFDILRELAKPIPKYIAESYGDKFTSLDLALNKLEKAMQIISDVIAKLDFLMASLTDSQSKETLHKLLKRYQTQRIKILNLKRAWERVFRK